MLIDISWPIAPDTLLHPEDPKPQFRTYSAIAEGAEYNLTQLDFSLHTGTHFDAPRHFFDAGPAIDELPPDWFAVPCHVVDTGDAPSVEPEHFAELPIAAGEAVLFKTANERRAREEMGSGWTYISEAAARRLVALGVRIVGMDYIEVERGVDEHVYPVHTAVLGAGSLLLENVDLREVQAGKYKLYCFPLKIAGAEGAPCRAVLETL